MIASKLMAEEKIMSRRNGLLVFLLDKIPIHLDRKTQNPGAKVLHLCGSYSTIVTTAMISCYQDAFIWYRNKKNNNKLYFITFVYD